MKNRTCYACLKEKPINQFPYVWKRKSTKRKNICKLCKQERYKETRKKNDVNYRFKKFNFTYEDYLNLLEEQGGKCAICPKTENQEYHKNFNIDHDHKTGKVRGLLCNGCNTGLGLFKDNTVNLQSAINYLNKYSLPT